MTIDRLIFFRKPSVSQICKEKKLTYVDSARDLTNIIDCSIGSETMNEVPVLTENPVPPQYYSGQNFLKRGDAVQLKYDRSAEAVRQGVIEGRVHGPRRTRDAAYHGLTHGFYAGLEWFTPNFLERRRVLIDTSVHGFLLYLICRISPDQKSKIITRRYMSRQESPQFGQTYDVEVPSCTRNDAHPLTVTGIPLVDLDPERVLTFRRLNVKDHGAMRKTQSERVGCQFQHYMELTFKRPEPVFFCHHAIAAYFEISREIYHEKGRFPLQPFPIPKPRTIRFYNFLNKQTLRAYIDGEGHKRLRHLNLAEREIVWGHFMLKYKNILHDPQKNPFYAHDGIPTYRAVLNL